MIIPEALEKLRNRLSENLHNPDSGLWRKLTEEIAGQLAVHQASDEELWANVCWFMKTVCETSRSFY